MPEIKEQRTNEGNEGEKELEAEIGKASDFGQLYETLLRMGKIKGGHREYSAQEIIKKIESIRENIAYESPEGLSFYFEKDPKGNFRPGKSSLTSTITRAGGLREKVGELILQERGLL